MEEKNSNATLLHSNGQLRTKRDGDTEKGCQNLLYSRLLMMMITDQGVHAQKWG